jgi:hypothetical protein
VLTGAQRDAFDRNGLVKLPAAVARTDALAMQDRLWEHLAARDGVVRDVPETWRTLRPAGF